MYYDRGSSSSSGGGTGHIGIYSGNGKFIDAHPDNSPGVKKEQPIEGSRFDQSDVEFFHVKTATQGQRDNAVAWAEGNHGKEFSISSPAPGADDKWYCSELAYWAYKGQGILLGTPLFGLWILPSSVIGDNDMEEISPESSLPVELSRLTATRNSGGVLIRWRTESEQNNLGFNIYRVSGSKEVKINPQIIRGHGTVGSPHNY